jgi:hypothetical protein
VTRRTQGFSIASLLLVAACGGQDLVGPPSDDCPAAPLFSALPVELSHVNNIAIWGGVDGPGHTLPTAHTGFLLATEGATVRSPADMQITRIRRVRYVASPNRQGVEDYAHEFQVCKQISGWFGHITTLPGSLQVPESEWRECQTYSTATETVQSCSAYLDRKSVTAGEVIGTGGHSIALGLMGLDFGLRDSRVNNFYINPARHSNDAFTSICPWDQFTPALKEQLYAKLRDLGRPGLLPSGEPRCGTMTVDAANTAKGVWVVEGTNPQPGNETDYVVLTNYPYRPQDHLALSIGPASLGAVTAVVPRQATGRVNRGFEAIAPDGSLYCYGLDVSRPTTSWIVSLLTPTSLRIRRVTHTLGTSPCLADPSTWSLTGAVNLIR